MVGEFAQHPPEIQFRVSGLEAALERRLELPLSFRPLRALAEQIGIATEVLCRRERDARS
jgi:hypothetical protein